MQEIQPELIEKYQILLEKDPKSQVFAPLTEAYRKMGMVEEAFRIAVRGVQFNPAFGGGRIALARVFLDRENIGGAINELEKARDLSPDNILAHLLLGDCYLKTQRSKDALKAFKMVLFLAPTNEKAQKAVRKLESLTADEYEDDIFEMKQLPNVGEARMEPATPIKPVGSGGALTSELERVISLADAYIVRNDLDRALEVLKQGEQSFGRHPEMVKRMKLVSQRHMDTDNTATATQLVTRPPSRQEDSRDRKIRFLQNLLVQIDEFAR